MNLHQTTRPPAEVDVAIIDLGHAYGWRVTSEYGCVKIRSTRDGCMIAMNSLTARNIAKELFAAINEAADITDIRSYGAIQHDH